MVSVYYNDQCFLMQTIYRCCFLKQKIYLSIEMRQQKRNRFWRYRNSIMVLTYLLNIPGRAMFFGILKAHILKLKLSVYSLWTRKRNQADIHAQKKKLTHAFLVIFTSYFAIFAFTYIVALVIAYDNEGRDDWFGRWKTQGPSLSSGWKQEGLTLCFQGMGAIVARRLLGRC